MELILRADNAKDWIYKGEGAANIVLGYTGSFGCLLGKVLRVKKVPRGQVSSKNGSFLSRHEILLWGGIVELAESTSNEIVGKAFVMNVMGPLLDHKHVDGGILVIVTTDFLKCIANNVLCLRPASRVDASEVDTLCDHALLLSDHSVILKKSVPGSLDEEVCFAIELKPKCGFLPQSEFIAKRNAIKKHVTRFKMHQILKLHQRQYDDLPIDTFMEYVLQFVAFHMKDFFIHKKHNAEPDAVDLLMEASSRFINIAYLSITCVISVNTLAFFLNPDGRILMCYAFISSS